MGSSPRPPRLRVKCSSQEQQHHAETRRRGGGRRDLFAGASKTLKSWMERCGAPARAARPGKQVQIPRLAALARDDRGVAALARDDTRDPLRLRCLLRLRVK